MSSRNRDGTWHYRFHATGREWTENTGLAASDCLTFLDSRATEAGAYPCSPASVQAPYSRGCSWNSAVHGRFRAASCAA